MSGHQPREPDARTAVHHQVRHQAGRARAEQAGAPGYRRRPRRRRQPRVRARYGQVRAGIFGPPPATWMRRPGPKSRHPKMTTADAGPPTYDRFRSRGRASRAGRLVAGPCLQATARLDARRLRSPRLRAIRGPPSCTTTGCRSRHWSRARSPKAPGPRAAWPEAAEVAQVAGPRPAVRDDLTKFEATVRSRAEDPRPRPKRSTRRSRRLKRRKRPECPASTSTRCRTTFGTGWTRDSGKTLLKVGHSARDAYYRANSAGRLTSLPEDPILLRIYPAQESAAREKDFHAWLRDADHAAGRGRRAGSEWFVTSTKFLDRVATAMGLDVRVINDLEAGDET